MAEVSAEDFADILALDNLTLRAHTQDAGQVFDLVEHEKNVRLSFARSELVIVRRDQKIVAYANLWRQHDDVWFAGMINVHPDHRNASVLRKLFGGLRGIIAQQNIKTIQSNVYKLNTFSIAFHTKLGFEVTRENEFGFEFTLLI